MPNPNTTDPREILAVTITGTFNDGGKFTTALCDHIEMDHERELAPGTTLGQIRDMHAKMHEPDGNGEPPDHWNHTHRSHR